MQVFYEGNLEVHVPDDVTAWKFYDTAHKLSHCMKAVDLVLETPTQRIFIEIKDGDAPSSPQTARADFVKRLQSGALDNDLVYKCRDSFLYGHCAGWSEKPLSYIVLIALDSLTPADLVTRTNALEQKLPRTVPTGLTWTPFVKACLVLNIAAWQRHLPTYPLRRRSTH